MEGNGFVCFGECVSSGFRYNSYYNQEILIKWEILKGNSCLT